LEDELLLGVGQREDARRLAAPPLSLSPAISGRSSPSGPLRPMATGMWKGGPGSAAVGRDCDRVRV
jgi:hypothetical protein